MSITGQSQYVICLCVILYYFTCIHILNQMLHYMFILHGDLYTFYVVI